jgi:hypothetical protein
MYMARVTIENHTGSVYSQSGMIRMPALPRESANDFDERTWRAHCSTNREGYVVIPVMAAKMALDDAAKKLGMKVKGRGSATYAKFFASGVFPGGEVVLMDHAGKPLTPADASVVTISANPRGLRGGGQRVDRRYPVFERCRATVDFIISDPIITQEIFKQHVEVAFSLIGIGRFRPEKGGINGRFKVVKIEFLSEEETLAEMTGATSAKRPRVT